MVMTTISEVDQQNAQNTHDMQTRPLTVNIPSRRPPNTTRRGTWSISRTLDVPSLTRVVGYSGSAVWDLLKAGAGEVLLFASA